MDDPIWVIHLLDDGKTLDAGSAVVQRPIRVWTNLD
jgi:hypothetical protein